MAIRITKRVVESLGSGDAVWDEDVRGFGVRCQRRDRVYVLKYRFAGRQRWLTIGKHGAPWTVELARKEAMRLLGLIADGIDPAEQREFSKGVPTVAQLCDLYLSEGVRHKKPSTISTDWGRIEAHIKPLLGNVKVNLVTKMHVERMVAAITAGKTARTVKTNKPKGVSRVKGGPGTANSAKRLLSSIMAFAIDRGLRETNPCSGVRLNRERKLERFLSPVELVRLGEALTCAERESVNPLAIAAIRLLLLTGCRKGEILGLEWSWVKFEGARLCFPDSKTGEKVIQIGAAALEVLARIPRTNSPYVFPSESGSGHLSDVFRAWRHIRQLAGLADVRIHDLRHSFAAVGASGGDSLLIVGKLLGHRNTITTARYAHLADDPVKAAAERISSEVAALLNGKSGGVVQLE
jgi:integrase